MKLEDIDAYQALESLEIAWGRRGVEFAAYADPPRIEFARLVVPKKRRNRGVGTKVMKDLIQIADGYGLLITVNPVTDLGATSVERLEKFYERFGFVQNKGRNKIRKFSEPMYRRPNKALVR